MRKSLVTLILAILTSGFTLVQECENIDLSSLGYDYSKHPYQPYDFEHLELNLTLDPEHALVSGLATYTMSARFEKMTEVILQASELAVSGVSVDGNDADFNVSNDSLIVYLPDTANVGTDFKLEVAWQSTSAFGLYRDKDLNFWSSSNPLSHNHWFPVFDHPRNELTFDAWFNIPYETEILFNGDLVGTEMESATKKRVHYRSTVKVPVTGLGFAVGDMVISEVTSGLAKVRLFSSETGYTDEQRASVLREAAMVKKEVENFLSFEYPWKSLNIVVLPDNYWELRTYGAGTVFLFENMGSVSSQLKRAIYAQWFGEYQRQEQFFDESGNMDFMRTALHYAIYDEPAMIDYSDSLNTVMIWNQWQESFQREDQKLREIVKNSLPNIARSLKGVISFADYAELWYQDTGIPYFDLPVPDMEVKGLESSEELRYSVDALYDEMDSNLNLVFKQISGNSEALHSLQMKAFGFEDTTLNEVLFTGDIDTVSFSLSPSVEYVSLYTLTYDTSELEFGEFPLYFLLNQMRSSEPEQRILAARLLDQYAENPDLQLALNDALNSEQDPEVRSAILATLARITAGDTGTEENFISGLSSPDESVVLSSLEALRNYPENEMVANAVRNKVIRNNSNQQFDKALDVYSDISSTDEILSLAKRLQRVDSTGNKVLKTINKAIAGDTTGQAVEMTDAYLGLAFPYSTRSKALELLLAYDFDEVAWKERLEILKKDRDPRIRFQAISGVKHIPAGEALLLLNSVETNEFDLRVQMKVEELKEGLSE